MRPVAEFLGAFIGITVLCAAAPLLVLLGLLLLVAA